MSELQGAVALAQIRKADLYMRGYRTAFRRIAQRLKLPRGVQLQRSADPKGDAGACLIFYMPTAAEAKSTLAALQAEGVPAGGIYDHTVKDWHIYTHWEHILDQKAVARDGLPWTGVPKAQRPKYSRTMCPRCTEYLERAISVGIHWAYSDADCAAIAKGINKVLASPKAT